MVKDSLLYFCLNYRFYIFTYLSLVLMRFKVFITSLIVYILLQKIIKGKENTLLIFLRSLLKTILFLAVIFKA